MESLFIYIKNKHNMEQQDNRRTHFYLSLLKSGFRLASCYYLLIGKYQVCAILLAIAEIIGIAEEL